jgi:hypothetical protein
MKIKFKFIYLLSFIACIHLSHSISGSSELDPHQTIEIPIFHGGYKVQKIVDASKETKAVTYQIQTNHPPADVLEFYDAHFTGRGWRPSFEICQRNWEDIRKGTKTGGPLLRQLFASWEHTELDLKAVLWLTYEMVDKRRQSEVTVKCSLLPKADK